MDYSEYFSGNNADIRNCKFAFNAKSVGTT